MSDTKLTTTSKIADKDILPIVGGAVKFKLPAPAHLVVADLAKLPTAVRERFPHFLRYYHWAPGNPFKWYADHAHRSGQEILICTDGLVEVHLSDGRCDGETTALWYRLTLSYGEALYIPPMVWHKVRAANVDGELAVLADTSYDREADYLEKDFAAFVFAVVHGKK